MSSLPPGLIVVPDFISQEEHDSLLSVINDCEWEDYLKRRVQHYLRVYNYKSSDVSKRAPDPPKEILDLYPRLEKYLTKCPEQIIVNEYEPGQGISAHIDHKNFGEPIISISLGSQCVMIFKNDSEKFEVVLPVRSCVIMTGDSRNIYTHEIPKRLSDKINGVKIPRKTRVSITFRVLRDKPL